MGMKFDFKFESWENFYKGFPFKKKNYMGIPCKMNQDQNSMGFFCKVFCWKKERKKRKERKMKERKKERLNERKKERKACCTPTYDAPNLNNRGYAVVTTE